MRDLFRASLTVVTSRRLEGENRHGLKFVTYRLNAAIHFHTVRVLLQKASIITSRVSALIVLGPCDYETQRGRELEHFSCGYVQKRRSRYLLMYQALSN
jgi:hypothetical protein